MVLPAEFDHIVIAVPDLAESVEQCEAHLGVRPVPGGVHPGRGTANALLGLTVDGGRLPRGYLELLGPDPAQDAELSGLTLGEVTAPTVQRWAMHPADFDGAVTAAAESTEPPVSLGEVEDMSRSTPEGDLLQWRLTRRTPLALGGIQPFLIDWRNSPHPASRDMPSVGLERFWASTPDVGHVRRVLGVLDAGIEVDEGTDDSLHVELNGPAGTWTL